MSIELKSTFRNLANLRKESFNSMDIYSLEQILAQKLIVESGANQVSGAFFGGIISGSDG